MLERRRKTVNIKKILFMEAFVTFGKDQIVSDDQV